MIINIQKPIFISLLFTVIVLSGCQHKPNPAESMAEFCQKIPRPEYSDLKRIDYASEWFELYAVAPGVTAIYEPFQWQEAISYLIEGDDKALLFDSGNGIGDIAKVVKALTNKPVSVLNSHSHYDHVGGNYAFENIYGMNTAFTRDRQSGHKNADIAIEASKLLIEAGADVNAKDNKQDSPYLYAGAEGKLEILKLTIAAGADLKSINRYGGTALTPAAHHGHVEVVRYLVTTDVDIDQVNNLGWTALLEAVILGNGNETYQEIIKILLDAGADKSISDNNNDSPLDHAKVRQQVEVIKLLAAK